MPITEYSGENLLQNEIIQKIQKEADLLLQNKDVTGAWQAGAHLKAEIAKISPELISPVLVDYRKITTKLKALSLPLLDLDEVINLLQNNLEFIEKSYLHYFVGGIKAWIASQPEQDQKDAIQKILSKIPSNSPFLKEIETAVQSVQSNTSNLSQEIKNIKPVKVSNKDNQFNKEEVEDLQTHARKAAEVGTSGLKVDNLDKIAQEIFVISQSKEEKEAFLRRTKALLKSRLRDIRTSLNLREYFSRPFAVGGIGITGENLDKCINISEDAYRILHKEKISEIVQKSVTPTNKQAQPVIASKVTAERSNPVTDADSANHGIAAVASTLPRNDTSKPKPIPKPAQKLEIPKSIPKPIPSTHSADKKPDTKIKLDNLIAQDASDSINLKSLIPKKSSEVRVQISEPGVQKKSTAPKFEIPKSAPKSEIKRDTTRIIRPENNNLDGKSRMHDITHTQGSPNRASIQTVDLTGELNLINLNDFRKLGEPEQAVQSLLQKLEVLEQDSITKKIQGIKALRASELNRQYIAIGESSVGGSKKLADVLSDKSLNPDSMTEDEFFAIATLNSKLK